MWQIISAKIICYLLKTAWRTRKACHTIWYLLKTGIHQACHKLMMSCVMSEIFNVCIVPAFWSWTNWVQIILARYFAIYWRQAWYIKRFISLWYHVMLEIFKSRIVLAFWSWNKELVSYTISLLSTEDSIIWIFHKSSESQDYTQ